MICRNHRTKNTIWQLGLLATLWAALSTSLVHAKSNRPNVVFIMADDMGIGDLSCYNAQSKITTPHMDALAKDGMRFTDAHSGSAVCTPTRYGVLTGRYCWRSKLKSGVTWGKSACIIPKSRLTVASFLKTAGYNTGCVGKWHLGLDWARDGKKINYTKPITLGPKQLGFDFFFGIPASLDMPPYVYVENDKVLKAPTAKIAGKGGKAMIRGGPAFPGFREKDVLPDFTKQAVGFIDRQSKDKPFFLYFPLASPHTPVAPNKAFLGKSKAGLYGDFVIETDWAVGQVTAALKKKGVYENTLIIVTSDNGSSPHGFPIGEEKQYDHLTSHLYKGRKSHTYEGGHRVAFIAAWPNRIKAGTVSTQVVCLTDLLATCADVLGQKIPQTAGEDSVSFLPALDGKQRSKSLRDSVVHHSLNGTFCLRHENWKIIFGKGHGGFSSIKQSVSRKPIQLYDMKSDVGETKNVASSHPEVVEQLRAMMAGYVTHGRSTPGTAQSNDGPKHWSQLKSIIKK